jgi:hypothetical protein
MNERTNGQTDVETNKQIKRNEKEQLLNKTFKKQHRK